MPSTFNQQEEILSVVFVDLSSPPASGCVAGAWGIEFSVINHEKGNASIGRSTWILV